MSGFSLDRIAGVIADAVRDGLLQLPADVRHREATIRSDNSAVLGSEVSAPENPPLPLQSAIAVSGIYRARGMTIPIYQQLQSTRLPLAAGTVTSRGTTPQIPRPGSADRTITSARPPHRFQPPSMFSRPGKRGRRGTDPGHKPITYVRDIVCLPQEYQAAISGLSAEQNIPIPRGSQRAALAEVGLFGKIQFSSLMTPEQVHKEICQIFAKPMGLSVHDLEDNKFFPFHYLQRTGAGSRSLCAPAVSSSFEWNGRQVATLAKSSGYLYIVADEPLPGMAKVQTESPSTVQAADFHEV